MPSKRALPRQRGKGVMDFLRSGARFIKDKQLISRGLSMIPHPAAQAASTIAGLVGLGRRRRRKRTMRSKFAPGVPISRKAVKSMRGRGIFGDLGGGLGSAFHGLFGNGRSRKTRGRKVLKF